MSYDLKWEQKQTVDIRSLDNLIVWLESKPAKEAYEFTDSEKCLLSQYLTDMGYVNVRVHHMGNWGLNGVNQEPLPSSFSWDIANADNQTFGAALKRARNLKKHA